MAPGNPLAALVAPELLARAAAVELPPFALEQTAAAAPSDAAPASQADENYRLMPIG